MKILILIFLAVSCTKVVTVLSDKNAVTLISENLNYMILEQQLDKPYYSEQIQMFEFTKNNLVLSMGVANDYRISADKLPRIGNHPDPEFKNQTAVYKLNKISPTEVELIFDYSLCGDNTKNPFHSIIPTGSKIVLKKTQDSLEIKINGDDTIVVGNLINENRELFNTTYIPRTVLCEGESNE